MRERERCHERGRSDFSLSREEERRGSPHASPCDVNNGHREMMRGERKKERGIMREERLSSREEERRGSPHASPCDVNNVHREMMRGERKKERGIVREERLSSCLSL